MNERPVARISRVTPAIQVHKGAQVVLSGAASYDPDDDRVFYSWSTSCADCLPLGDGASDQLAFQLAGKQIVSVRLEVTDELGAASEPTTLQVIPVNRAPELAVQVQEASSLTGTFPLGTSLHLIARASDPDDDGVTFEPWKLERPPASSPSAMPLVLLDTDQGEQSYVFTPDVEGVWTVEVPVTDDDAETPLSKSVRRTIVIAGDTPPCLAVTSPPAGPLPIVIPRDDGPRRLAVESVIDDQDPYPFPVGADDAFGETSFRWFVRRPDQASFTPVTGLDTASHVFSPEAYLAGDQIDVRAEIADRSHDWPACPDTERTCSRMGDDCQQRVTWTLEVR